MAKIKMLKTAMVGPHVRARGWVGPADDAEAEGLKAAGYAKDTSEANTDDAKPAKGAKSDHAALLEGTVPEITDRLAGMSKADLKALSKLEAKGGNRVTLIAAIDAAAESAE